MAETAFGVTYDGPALADRRMAVRDLAPALLALGDVFTQASVIAFPNREPVALNIRATGEGSFTIELILQAGDAWDRVREFLISDTGTALTHLFEIVGGATGLFAVIKNLSGKQIRTRETPEPGRVRLTTRDGLTLEMPEETWALYGNANARKKARQVVEPLDRPGVERFDFRRENQTTVEVEAHDVPAYEVPEKEEPLFESETQIVLEIAAVAFRPKHKWQFTVGDETFFASIEDETFWERVTLRIEAFRSGDLLLCRMRIVQSRRPDGSLQTDRFVTQVIKHIPAEPQLELDEEPSP